MATRISTRISIRWPPELASEPTDTLVLSLGGWYVDLRIDKASKTIDWALAGQRIVLSEDPLKVQFTHPLDSHCIKPGDQADEAKHADVGEFSKLPNGDDLEVGEMAASHMGGRMMPYEEVWRELSPSAETPPDPFFGNAEGWIIESKDDIDGEMTFYARINGFYLGVQRRIKRRELGNAGSYEYVALREDYDATGSKWTRKYFVGDVQGMISMAEMARSPTEPRRAERKMGDLIEIGQGRQFVVRAVVY